MSKCKEGWESQGVVIPMETETKPLFIKEKTMVRELIYGLDALTVFGQKKSGGPIRPKKCERYLFGVMRMSSGESVGVNECVRRWWVRRSAELLWV